MTITLDKPTFEWLRYGSYVDERRRILYLETPKCGCSSIKHMLLGDRPLHFNPLARQTKLDMMIHDRDQLPFKPLMAFEGPALDDILGGDGWYRFCVLRQPAERFFSAWRDKIFLVEPGMEPYLPADGRRYVEFEDFYRRVVSSEDPRTCNPHWRAQSALVVPELIRYSKIYDISELPELPGDLKAHLAAQGLPDDIPALRRANEGYAVPPDGFLTAEILAGLRDFYKADHDRWNFPEPKVGWSEKRSAADLANQFTDAIFERNRLVNATADWIRATYKK